MHAPQKYSQSPQPRKPRHNYNWVLIFIALLFFAAYMWLASQMEGISFDTTYIAAYCTFLSVFVIQCFRMPFLRRRRQL